MTISLLGGARPPYVEFVEKLFEDRAATQEGGAMKFKAIDYVVVRQIGSKDTFEKDAKEWLDSLRTDPNMAPEWAAHFRSMYAQWKSGQEITPDGIHVRTWSLISRAQAENLIRANLRTVEDLARAPESALMAVGIGARELQHKARAWLDTALDKGKTVEEVTTLRNTVSEQADSIKQLRAALDRMEKKLDAQKAASTEEDLFSDK